MVIWIVVQTHWAGWLALTVFTHSLWEFRFRFLLTDVNNRIAGKWRRGWLNATLLGNEIGWIKRGNLIFERFTSKQAMLVPEMFNH